MKRILICILVSFLLVCGFKPVSAQNALQEKFYNFLIFGDSLSAGYRLGKTESFAAQLQKALDTAGYKQVRVINVSQSGRTTAGGLNNISKALNRKPNAVLLELGINDVLHGFPVTTIEQNLSQIIQKFQKADIPVLLAGMKAPPITEPIYAQQYEKMYKTLAQKYHLTLYPFFMQGIFEAAGNQYHNAAPYLMSDKAHPKQEGIALMVQHIFPMVQLFLKQQKVYPNK